MTRIGPTRLRNGNASLDKGTAECCGAAKQIFGTWVTAISERLWEYQTGVRSSIGHFGFGAGIWTRYLELGKGLGLFQWEC